MKSDSINQWLTRLGLARYQALFAEHDIDFRSLPYLTEEDLRELGMSLGHRRILIEALKNRESGQHPGGKRDRQVSLESSSAERRQLSVMFCDIVNSTELAHRMDPEDMREILRQYQDTVGNAVRRYNGYVARFFGDGILSYFGWPQAYEDQTERAVRASLEATRDVTGIKVDADMVLQARIGIESGEVVVGDLVGAETSDDKTVTGVVPNLAARLQTIAEPGKVVVGESTYLLVSTVFDFTSHGVHRFKGFPGETRAWAVTGEKVTETRFEATRGKAGSTMVGREHELGLLRDRWSLTQDDEGQFVLLSGEAGIGKSRVVQAFVDEVAGDGCYYIHYQCSPYHSSNAFYPVVTRLLRAARISNTDSVEAKQRKLRRFLHAFHQDNEITEAIVADLLSIPARDKSNAIVLTPQQIRQHTIEILTGQMLHLSSQKPVLCVVEDVHWIDPSMLEFLAELIPRISERQIFLLVTFRPDNPPRLAGYPHTTAITLNRLGKRYAARIAHAIGGQKLLDALIDQIVNRADGVPLFIEELTKSVVEKYSMSQQPAFDELIPATLQSSLIARLDHLNDARDIAQIGSVLGRDFSHELISRVSGLPDSQLDRHLARLVASDLVFVTGKPPASHYTFKHALIHDAAYNTILIRRRQVLHGKVLEVLESQPGERSRDEVIAMAFHANQGQVWDKALRYFQEAGRKSMDQAAVREAVAQFERALEAGAKLPETRESMEWAVDLRFDLRNAQWSIGAFQDILENLKRARSLAAKLDDQRRLGWISVFNSASLWQLGRKDEALAAANLALAASRKAGDLPLEVGSHFYLGCATITTGNCRQAEKSFARVVEILTGDLAFERCGLPFVPAVIARSWLVWALAERGEFSEAQRHGDDALAIARAVGHPFNIAHIYYDLGYFYQVKGDYDAAVDALETGLQIVREWSLTYLSPFMMGFLGHACALAGDTARGLPLLEQANNDYEALGLGLFRSLVGIQLGESRFLAGDPDGARESLLEGTSLAEARGEEGHLAYGYKALGDLAREVQDNAGALSQYLKALQLAEAHGMRPLQARCRRALASLGDRADENNQLADQLCRQIGISA